MSNQVDAARIDLVRFEGFETIAPERQFILEADGAHRILRDFGGKVPTVGAIELGLANIGRFVPGVEIQPVTDRLFLNRHKQCPDFHGGSRVVYTTNWWMVRELVCASDHPASTKIVDVYPKSYPGTHWDSTNKYCDPYDKQAKSWRVTRKASLLRENLHHNLGFFVITPKGVHKDSAKEIRN